MRKILTIIMALSMCTPMFSRSATVRVGSYNLRMQQLDKGDNAWSVRRARLMQSIRDNAFDVFGVQEVADFAQDDLREDLGDTYDFVFFSPYSQDGKGNKAQGIAFRKSRFKLVESRYFWYSDEDPLVMTENDHIIYGGKKHHFKRGGLYAILKDRKTGKKIFFLNNHGILDKEENLRYAHVHLDIEKKYNTKGYPSFFVGDFNARANHPSHELYRSYWKDAADIASDRGPTFNGFKSDTAEWNLEAHIDFIYYRNIGDPVEYKCNRDLIDGFYASDHFPIWADFKL